jgi:putative transcriptional regulator
MQKGPASFIITLGCAGWGPGQLETEVKANAWLTTPAVEPIIFDVPHEMKWAEAIKKMGINPVFLSNTAGHA